MNKIELQYLLDCFKSRIKTFLPQSKSYGLIEIIFDFYGHTTDDTLAPLNASPIVFPNLIEEIKQVHF